MRVCDVKNSYIYAIRCKNNGKLYIGRTTDVKARYRQHLSELRRMEKTACHAPPTPSGARGPTEFQNDFIKYGEDAFEVYVLENEVPPDQRAEREGYWIKRYHSDEPEYGYNIICARRKADFPLVPGLPPEPT